MNCTPIFDAKVTNKHRQTISVSDGLHENLIHPLMSTPWTLELSSSPLQFECCISSWVADTLCICSPANWPTQMRLQLPRKCLRQHSCLHVFMTCWYRLKSHDKDLDMALPWASPWCWMLMCQTDANCSTVSVTLMKGVIIQQFLGPFNTWQQYLTSKCDNKRRGDNTIVFVQTPPSLPILFLLVFYSLDKLRWHPQRHEGKIQPQRIFEHYLRFKWTTKTPAQSISLAKKIKINHRSQNQSARIAFKPTKRRLCIQ